MILKQIKCFFIFLLTFLLGAQTTYAKTEFILHQKQLFFSIEKNQTFRSLEKEVPLNIGFLKEKAMFVISEIVSAQNQHEFSRSKWSDLANSVDDVLAKLLKNSDYKKFYDDLASGATPRRFVDELTLQEEAVLKYYTTNAGYKKFNQALRGEIKMNDEFLAQEKLMNQALNKLPNSSYKDLYRIENLTEAQIISLYKEGNIITSKAFTSSTYSEEALIDAMRARSHTLLIRMKGKNGKLIEDLSTLRNEMEVLFKSKTKFKVTKVDYSANPNDDYMSKIRTVWLEEL